MVADALSEPDVSLDDALDVVGAAGVGGVPAAAPRTIAAAALRSSPSRGAKEAAVGGGGGLSHGSRSKSSTEARRRGLIASIRARKAR